MSRRTWSVVSFLGLTVVAALVIFQLALSRLEADQLFDLEDRLAGTAHTLALASSDDLASGDFEAIRKMLRSTEETQLTRIRILDAKRELVADSYGPVDRPEALRFRPEIQAAFVGRYGAYTRLADENEKSLALFVAVPVKKNQNIVGAVYLSRSTDAILQRLGVLRRWLRGALFALTLAIFLGALWMTRAFRQDLERLGRVSELKGFHPKADDEVDRVSQSLTYLVESLRRKVAELEGERDKTRRFVEDIAHELKTPVTGLQGAVEALKPALKSEGMFANIERESRRLAELISLLLELRKLEYYQLKIRPYDLASLIETIIEKPGFHEPSRLRCEVPEICHLEGDPYKIQRVVENLVENALRCSPPESPVTVRLREEADEVVLTVEDLGPGVKPEDAEQIFGRGQRGAAPTGHLGLGLAVVAQIVGLHGGEFGLEPDRERGAAFYVRLPRVPPDPSQKLGEESVDSSR